MKLKYVKPPTFPKWSKINPNLADKQRYYLRGNGIETEFNSDTVTPHSNHIEMSGFFCSAIISYRVKQNRSFELYRFAVFPSVRVNPNNTHGSLCEAFDGINISSDSGSEKLTCIKFDGILCFNSLLGIAKLCRSIFPAVDKRALIEEICIDCKTDIQINVDGAGRERAVKSCYTPYDYDISLKTNTYLDGDILEKDGIISLSSGRHTITVIYAAEDVSFNQVREEKNKRVSFINDNLKRLKITTPDDYINREIQFAKLRASESIFMTKNGLMHSPGGGNYYAALWTNDQCEYANPFFAYLGYDKANEQSLNCYSLYSKLVSDDKAVYTSICSEGDDYWHGAGDRGDTSMYVYGFARWLLTVGDKKTAEKYLPVLETACRYIESKINSDDVVNSDSDELENRFESGEANLSTAVISYDAFVSMSYIEKEFGKTEMQQKYKDLAERIRNGIENYFGAEVEGYNTYRYCTEEMHLRSWICLPLTVGINDRLDQTLSALKSDKLKKPCGLLTQSGNTTYWDRSLLYALRGIFYAGRADEALEMLREYTFSRLFCEHVPYPVEAFPEGNGAHLSAESALYVRIFTEGVMGFRPLGFNRFELKPSLPEKWDNFSVEGFICGGVSLTINLNNTENKVRVQIPEIDIDMIVENNQSIEITI